MGASYSVDGENGAAVEVGSDDDSVQYESVKGVPDIVTISKMLSRKQKLNDVHARVRHGRNQRDERREEETSGAIGRSRKRIRDFDTSDDDQLSTDSSKRRKLDMDTSEWESSLMSERADGSCQCEVGDCRLVFVTKENWLHHFEAVHAVVWTRAQASPRRRLLTLSPRGAVKKRVGGDGDVNKKRVVESKKSLFQCEKSGCEKKYVRERNLEKHCVAVHSTPMARQSAPSSQSSVKSSSTPVKSSRSSQAIGVQKRWVKTSRGFECRFLSQCDKVYQSSSGVREHITRDHLMKRFKCPICEQIFTQNRQYTKHWRKEHKD